MEVTRGATHASFPMEDGSRVGEARRHAAQLSEGQGWSAVDAGRLALVVTELGANLVRHAQRGRLLLAARADAAEVEIVALDHGPGIVDVARCLGDGYSTGGTPGTGLGAVRRLSDEFDIASTVPSGTVVVARLRGRKARTPPGRLRVGGVCLPAPGEGVSGDGWIAGLDGQRAALLLADGLGHGAGAAEAAQAACAAFAHEPFAPLRLQLERAHAALRGTRGAAVTVLQADAMAAELRMAGAGNVALRVVSGVADRGFAPQHGTVGVQMRAGVQEQLLPWPEHAILVAHSDGIESRWDAALLRPLLHRDPALIAAVLLREHLRGRDDATVVVVKAIP